MQPVLPHSPPKSPVRLNHALVPLPRVLYQSVSMPYGEPSSEVYGTLNAAFADKVQAAISAVVSKDCLKEDVMMCDMMFTAKIVHVGVLNKPFSRLN